MQTRLCCDSLGELANGTARASIDAAFKLALTDLDDRGEDGKARKVVIEVQFAKADSGLITATVECGAKVPAFRTAGTAGRLRPSDRNNPAAMLFQTMSADNPDQTTIDQYERRPGLAEGEIPNE